MLLQAMYHSTFGGPNGTASDDPPSSPEDTKNWTQIASDASSQPMSETASQAKDTLSTQAAAAGAAVAGMAAAGASAIAAAPTKAKEVVAGSSSATPTSDASDLQKQLNEALEEIKRLKEQLKSSQANGDAGLRQRNVTFKEEPSAALQQSIKEAQVEGVAMPKVLLICLLVFLFTWFVTINNTV